jgi:hypothetical protein
MNRKFVRKYEAQIAALVGFMLSSAVLVASNLPH